MNEAQKKLLTQTLRNLELLKCSFAVIDSDGIKYGALDVTTPKKSKRVHSYRQHGYKEVVLAMEVGDEYTFSECAGASKEECNTYRSAIGSLLIRTFGLGTSTATLNADGSVVAKRLK